MRYWTILLAVFVLVIWVSAMSKRLARPIDLKRFDPAPTGYRVNLNQTDVDTLTLLLSIGPQLAHRIMAYRYRHGPFAGEIDVQSVAGVGPVTLQRIRPFVTY